MLSDLIQMQPYTEANTEYRPPNECITMQLAKKNTYVQNVC